MKNLKPPLSPRLMSTFQKSVEKHFGKIALDLNSTLRQLSESLYGFSTAYGIAFIGVYHGHSPGVCVSLRKRLPGEKLGTQDDKAIGLANVIAFVDHSTPI